MYSNVTRDGRQRNRFGCGCFGCLLGVPGGDLFLVGLPLALFFEPLGQLGGFRGDGEVGFGPDAESLIYVTVAARAGKLGELERGGEWDEDTPEGNQVLGVTPWNNRNGRGRWRVCHKNET
jgi:hypothetical protein